MSRLIAAFVLIPCVIAALFWLPLPGFALVTMLICMLAAWEWGPLAGITWQQQRVALVVIVGLLLGGMQLIFPFPGGINSGLPLMTVVLWLSLGWWLAALVLVLRYPSAAVFWRHSTLIRLLFGFLTIIPFFWGMLALRHYHYETDPSAGAWWLLFVMLLVWSADSGAYIFGKLLGKHKLAPDVSPGKTWEGLVGGLLSSAVIAWIFTLVVPLQISTGKLVVCSLIATLASVLGDLTESMLKRAAGLKDSDTLIPGHGGILDRIDSLTAAVPVFACLQLLVFRSL